MFPHYIAYNFLFADLLHRFVYIEDSPYFLYIFLVPFLVWQISKYFFKNKWSMVPPTLLLITPWFWYSAIAHSFYFFLFFLMLSLIYGILLIRSDKTFWGNTIIFLAGLIATYISSLFLFLVPFSILMLILSKIVNFKQVKFGATILAISWIPLSLLIFQNKINFKNSLALEIRVFSDPGLINTVNRYQGAATESGYRILGKISENKYLFYTEYIALKYSNQLIPLTFFTPQYRLLDFSFEPPILLGFAIPFFYGLVQILHDKNAKKILFVSTILVIPSVLANNPVSLNRLILFLPVLLTVITYGLMRLFSLRRTNLTKVFIGLTAFLIIFQLAVVIGDIRHCEIKRFEQYFGQKYQLVEP